MDPAQTEANITLEKALRRANLLAAAAEVGQNITRILDVEELLPKTVDIICDAYNFYYAGVFIVDEAREFAVLRAGRGEPGRIMIENNHKLAVGGNSMIGAATALNEARISLDVDTEKVWYPNPVLPETRSEMALPLAIGGRVIGALTVQSTQEAAFSDEDIVSLQAMANQLAIAISNAMQRRQLDQANAELVRTKTFEAIATATGDAIHWIGNKSEPIGSSVARIRSDVQTLVCAVADAIADAPDEIKNKPILQLLSKESVVVREKNPEVENVIRRINKLKPDRLAKMLSLTSIMEDLHIIADAAVLILKIKEDLIGPAREQAPRPTMAGDVLQDAVSNFDKRKDMEIVLDIPMELPMVLADPLQLNRIFSNLLKNAYEAMDEQPNPQIKVRAYLSDNGKSVMMDVTDNGCGIATDRLDKLWIIFHTTKGLKGHAGLGLSACRLILDQIGGQISVTSQEGQGATFTMTLPVYDFSETVTVEPGTGKILLVDDYDIWQQFATDTLQSNGYTVAICEEDYSVDNYASYDLIIVDDLLLKADSFEMLKQIKDAGVIGKTVAVSSNPRVERTKDRKLFGVQNLLPKPYTQASLLNEVKNALDLINQS